jgi:hydrogenase expression/formation protein HypC
MCVAIPGEILSVEPNGTAVVDFGGTRRTVCISLLDRGEVGDFVIVHAGFALHRVDPEEARQTIELFRSTLDDDTF